MFFAILFAGPGAVLGSFTGYILVLRLAVQQLKLIEFDDQSTKRLLSYYVLYIIVYSILFLISTIFGILLLVICIVILPDHSLTNQGVFFQLKKIFLEISK